MRVRADNEARSACGTRYCDGWGGLSTVRQLHRVCIEFRWAIGYSPRAAVAIESTHCNAMRPQHSIVHKGPLLKPLRCTHGTASDAQVLSIEANRPERERPTSSRGMTPSSYAWCACVAWMWISSCVLRHLRTFVLSMAVAGTTTAQHQPGVHKPITKAHHVH